MNTTVFCLNAVCYLTFLAANQGEMITPQELIHRLASAQQWANCFSMEIIIKAEDRNPIAGRPRFMEKKLSVRRKGDLYECKGSYWFVDQNGQVDKDSERIQFDICNGQFFLSRSVDPSGATRARPAIVSRIWRERLQEMLAAPPLGPLCTQFGDAKLKGVASVLTQATDLRVLDEPVVVNGMNCYVLEGTTPYGKITVWLAPEKGYNCVKCIWKCSGQDLVGELPYDQRWPELKGRGTTTIFECQEFMHVVDANRCSFYVPARALLDVKVEPRDYKRDPDLNVVDFVERYFVTMLDLNPDFDAIGAFRVDLPEGTRVLVAEEPGLTYFWQNGRIVPDLDKLTVDQIDTIVDQITRQD